jgi:flagellar hook-length control protein FliK
MHNVFGFYVELAVAINSTPPPSGAIAKVPGTPGDRKPAGRASQGAAWPPLPPKVAQPGAGAAAPRAPAPPASAPKLESTPSLHAPTAAPAPILERGAVSTGKGPAQRPRRTPAPASPAQASAPALAPVVEALVLGPPQVPELAQAVAPQPSLPEDALPKLTVSPAPASSAPQAIASGPQPSMGPSAPAGGLIQPPGNAPLIRDAKPPAHAAPALQSPPGAGEANEPVLAKATVATNSYEAPTALSAPSAAHAVPDNLPVASHAALAAELSSLQPTPQQSTEPPAVEREAISAPVNSNGWAEAIGSRVVWMVHQGVTAASLRLEPEHLGPLEIKISLHQGAASVWFGASEPETRSALEQALPQLQQMFASHGLLLSDAGVSREPPRGSAQHSPSPSASANPASGENATEISVALPRRGLLDTYA